MRQSTRRLLLVPALLLGLIPVLAAAPALAAITSVTGTPAPLRVNIVAPQTLSVTWQVVRSASVPTTITSPSGQVFIDGIPVATLNGPLSRSLPPSGPVTVTFRETLRISRALARRIGEGGTIDYRRSFTETPPGVPVPGTIAMRATASGQLAIANLELSFADESRYRIVGQGTRLMARAMVTSTGQGMLEGVWEHAGPGSISAGQAAFVPLRRERRPLGGNRRTVLLSPALPTAVAGVHVLRFRPVRTGPDARVLVSEEIRYVVQPGTDPTPLALMAPGEAASLTAATRFVWRTTPGAATQRLEFLRAGAGALGPADRIAAVDLPGAVGTTRLRPFTLQRLSDGSGPVYWRVTAFDATGRALATSPIRRLSHP